MNLDIDERVIRREYERRREEWLYEDRYEPEPEPPFTEEERAALWRAHRPYNAEVVDWIERQPGYRPIEYVCSACYEEWKNGGCSTIRALAVLARRNAQVLQLNKRVRNMAEFLAEYFAKRFVGPGPGNIAECWLKVDGYMLAQGRMAVVDQMLFKMREQWKDYLERLFPPDPMEQLARDTNRILADQARRQRHEEQGDGSG